MVDNLTEADRERVSAAVRASEQRTSGEIIPVVVVRAGGYSETVYWAALVVALLLVALGWALFQRPAIIDQGWDQAVRIPYGPAWIAATILVAFLVTHLVAVFFPDTMRHFVRDAQKDRAAHRAAAEAFYRFRLTRTRARTAVLICVCLFERRVVVLGDEAINDRLEQTDWDTVRDAVLASVKTGDLAQGLVDGIALAGDLLSRNFPPDPDNPDEVTNELRVIA